MIRYFVGAIGCGKTSLACRLLADNIPSKKRLFEKHKYKYNFANFDTDLANYLNPQLLATYKPPQGSYIAIDESGIEFNSRDFKSFHKGLIEFFKLSRHFQCDCDLFSQTFDDTDKILRDLASEIWLVKRFGQLTYARCVYKRIGIDETTKQLSYQHFFKSALLQLLPFQPKQFIFCWRPKYYKHFDSYVEPERPLITEALGHDLQTIINTKIKKGDL